MTREEAIAKMKLIRLMVGDEKLNEAVEIAVDALTVQQWIPVWLCLPLCGEKVLVQTREGLITDGRYTGETWFTTDDYTCYHVVAWMPMPKPYKEENNDKRRSNQNPIYEG